MISWKQLRIPFLILIFSAVLVVLLNAILAPSPKKSLPRDETNRLNHNTAKVLPKSLLVMENAE